VRIAFAGVNPFDWKIAEGLLESRPHVFPLILGVDASGTVEAVGPGIARFQRGDRVFGQFLHDPVGTGTYAELAPVPEQIGIVRVPAKLGDAEAAALPTAGMTALAGLDALALPSGASLVIVGASGGVGSFATELAVAQGLEVTAIARASSSARLRSLGAADVVDPTPGDAPTVVAQNHPSGVDGLLDAMSDPPSFARWTNVVRRGGPAVTTTFSADIESLKQTGIRGVNLDMHPTSELLDRLVTLVTEHRLPIPLERRIHLEDSPATLAEMKAGRSSGKTVIEIGSQTTRGGGRGPE